MTSGFPRSVLSTNGVGIVVHDLGGRGRPLVLCHATGLCGMMWEPMAATLAERFHCLALDFRAHGDSPVPPGTDLAWERMAEDLAAVVAAVSPDQPVLTAGHSMGGAAIILAETARPGTFAAAWTFEPILLPWIPLDELSEEPLIATAARNRRAVFASRDEARDRWSSKPPLNRLDRRAMDAYVRHGLRDVGDGTVTLRCRAEDEAATFTSHNCGSAERIAEVRMPFRAAIGTTGSPGPARWVVEAAQRHPDVVELARYPDLSHFGPVEQPDRLAGDALGFFDRVAGS